MGLRDTARNAGASNPIPYGCVFYAPLWDNELSGAVFNSYDDFRHLCTVIGTVWGNTGRTSDGDDYKIGRAHV